MLRVAILVCLLAAMVSADDVPRFEDYRVAETFRGTLVPAVLSSAKARLFRTVLRREAASGPNFAGHFTLARWGCGAGCVAIAVIDVVTGTVVFAPFAVQDAWKDGHVVCAHSTDFEITSELFTARLMGGIMTSVVAGAALLLLFASIASAQYVSVVRNTSA
jgi:hypothetical protein